MLYFVLAVSVAYAIGLLVYPAVQGLSRISAPICASASLIVLACPLLIPAEHVVSRAFALLIVVDLSLKLVDFARRRQQVAAGFIGWADYLQFLVPFPALLVVYDRKRRAQQGANAGSMDVVRLAIGTAAFIACVVLMLGSPQSSVLRSSFPLDHSAKLVLFVVGIESLSQALWGMERLAGYGTKPIIDCIFLSCTPAEFWQRFNQRVHDWLFLNVFVPCGGGRWPAYGIVAVFAFSAVLHELAFGIATSRFDGYQAAFFLIQAPAVIVSRPAARYCARWGAFGAVLLRAATIGWLGVTSPLFLHGVDRVFPTVYVSQPWLP